MGKIPTKYWDDARAYPFDPALIFAASLESY
jgi:hypothetical protein